MFEVNISVTLIDQGIPKSLKFGKLRNLDSITISAMNKTCSEEFESTQYIDIRDGQTWESECTKFQALVLSSYKDSASQDIIKNVSLLISKNGESFFLAFKNL